MYNFFCYLVCEICDSENANITVHSFLKINIRCTNYWSVLNAKLQQNSNSLALDIEIFEVLLFIPPNKSNIENCTSLAHLISLTWLLIIWTK